MSTSENGAYAMCHNGHPFKPGNDMDRPGAPDPLWCNVCGEERRTSASGDDHGPWDKAQQRYEDGCKSDSTPHRTDSATSS